jgi:hypothetical protein
LKDEELSDLEIKAKAEYRKAFDAALEDIPLEAFENAELVLASPSDHGGEQQEFPAPNERTERWVKTSSQQRYHNKEIDERKSLNHG